MIDISLLVWPAVAFAVTTTVALALRTGILAGIGESPGPGLRIVRDGILRPSVLWCVALGLYAANEVALDASLPVRWYTRAGILLESFLLLSLTMALVSMTGRAVTRVGTWAGLSPDATGLARTTARLGLVVVGLLLLLSVVRGSP